MRISIVLIILLVAFWQMGKGQTRGLRPPLHYIAGYIYAGQIEIHSRKIEHFRGIRPYGVGMDFSWKFVSEKAYSLCSCYPSLGLSINYWDFGHESLGHALSTLFYIEPVIFSPLGTDVSLKAGMGVSYLDHPFTEEDNPLNLTYSTNFAFPLMIGVSANVPFNENWSLRLAGIFQHISNGGVSQPNLGINYTTLGIGLQRKLDTHTLPPPIEPTPFDAHAAEKGFVFTVAMGLKEPENTGNKAGMVGFSGEYLNQFARINAWSVGGYGEFDNSQTEANWNEKYRLSFMAGHCFLLGRFVFGQKAGLYLWRGHTTPMPWYQYYTLDFEVVNGLGVGVGLKAHGKVAEYLSIRLQYRL